ncbi:MAG TPA: hypothetical protein PLX89_27200, partial [Verrucomicrobiota bacterium]|nr:hypothetical protein [Verrucomicrobiota bacterium]
MEIRVLYRSAMELPRWCRWLAAALIALGAWTPGWAQVPDLPVMPEIVEIRVRFVGPATVSEDLIRGNIRTRVGERFNQNAVDDDIRNLFNTGF